VSVYPADGAEPDQLLRNADTAMYRAKISDAIAAVERLRLENDLRHALEHDEFELYVQPVVDLQSGAFVSAEALIR